MRTAILLAAVAGMAFGQQFEAASIRRLEGPYSVLGALKVSGTLVTFNGYTVSMLVSEAYGVKAYRVSMPANYQGGTYFFIEARAPGDIEPDKATLQAMLRNLLAERFHVTIHKEMRNIPIYGLVVSKNGPLLKAGTGEQDCRQVTGPVRPEDRNYRHSLQNCPISMFVQMLGADRPILDKTGLAGLYDILIFYTPEFRMQNANEPTDISIRDSVRQLGLQLDPQTEPMEIVVVDHTDATPSAN